MRFRSKLLSSHFTDLPWVSYCQVFTKDENIDFNQLLVNLGALKMDQEKSEFLILVGERSDQLDALRAEFSDQIASGFLKVGLYTENPIETRLKNIASGLAKGIVLMTVVSGDQLAPRMTSYTYNEMMTHEEKAIVYEKRGRKPHRVAFLRSSFYEIGGFDEAIQLDSQVTNLVDRLKSIGVNVEVKPHDHLTKSKEKRQRVFDFFRKKSMLNPEFQEPKESEFKWLA